MNFDTPSVDVRVRRQPPHLRSSHAIGLRLPAILLLALTLVGCGSSGNRGSYSGYTERPPTNRTALVAWQEWTKFGRSTVVYGGSVNGYTNRNGVTERSEPLSTRVGDYWGSCGHPEWNGRTSSRPWSGAFVSWVMGHAGVSQRDFTPAGRHGAYLASLYDRARAGQSGFRLHAPNEYSPKAGDLVCTGTAGPSWRFAEPRMAHRRLDNTANHCDVVTDVRGGFVHAVGGNVKNSVSMSLYPVDSRGRLVSSSGHPWMVVVENRVN